MTTATNYHHEGANDMLNTPSENNQTYHHILFAEEEQSEGDFHELVNKLRAVRRQGMRKVVHLALGFFFCLPHTIPFKTMSLLCCQDAWVSRLCVSCMCLFVRRFCWRREFAQVLVISGHWCSVHCVTASGSLR